MMECILPHFGMTTIALVNKGHREELDHLFEVLCDCFTRVMNT
jgi:hypothetical protein